MDTIHRKRHTNYILAKSYQDASLVFLINKVILMSASLTKSEWDHWCNEFGESHQTIVVFVAVITSTIISFYTGLKSTIKHQSS